MCTLACSSRAEVSGIEVFVYQHYIAAVTRISLQFRKKDVVRDRIKGLKEVQIHNTGSSALVHRYSHCIIEGH